MRGIGSGATIYSFIPNFWDINNIIVPKAGIVFNDQTNRDLTVRLVGGLCENSIVGALDSAVINIESTNGCFSKNLVVPPGGKKVKFDNVPPINYKVVLLYHSNGDILNAFGDDGKQVNLEVADSTLTFLYRSALLVETSDLPLNQCNEPMMEQFLTYQVQVRAYEEYGGQKCYLDSMHLEIVNELSGVATVDTSYAGGKFKHKFNAGTPKLTGDHMKNITYTLTDPFDNRQATKTIESVVIGKKIIRKLQKKQVGEEIRDLDLAGQMEKKGTPTMGGLIIITAILIPCLLMAKLANIYIIIMIMATVWMGAIGFLDDYIKVFKKDKEGLSGKFKILGQVGLGLTVGLMMLFNDDIKVRMELETAEKFDYEIVGEPFLVKAEKHDEN